MYIYINICIHDAVVVVMFSPAAWTHQSCPVAPCFPTLSVSRCSCSSLQLTSEAVVASTHLLLSHVAPQVHQLRASIGF